MQSLSFTVPGIVKSYWTVVDGGKDLATYFIFITLIHRLYTKDGCSFLV